MISEIMIKEVIQSFILLFVIMDPIGVLPIFLGLVKGMPKKVIKKQVGNAVFVACILMVIFILFGIKVLEFFQIGVVDIKIAGGIILLILGILYVIGAGINYTKDGNDISVPIGTPLLVGPGTITTLIILVGTNGILVTLIAAMLAITVTAIILGSSSGIYKILGKQWTNVISRIMGIILSALAVSFIKDGVVEILRSVV